MLFPCHDLSALITDLYRLCSRRGDLPFTMRRIVSRAGIESDEESEPKSETPEPKPE